MGFLQARILKWAAMPSSRGSSQPRDQTQVSCIATRFFTIWATRDVHYVARKILLNTVLSHAKGKTQKDGRRGKITFRIKPHTHQRCSGGSNKTLCTPGDFTETEPDLLLSICLSVSCGVQVSSGLLQVQGLWVQQTWVWHKPSWRRLPLTPP